MWVALGNPPLTLGYDGFRVADGADDANTVHAGFLWVYSFLGLGFKGFYTVKNGIILFGF
jgi:hypothetical protein